MKYYSMEDIKRINKDKGYHFFSPDTMRFFRSRVGSVYQGEGGVFFTTSEQNHGMGGKEWPRLHTVRQFNPETGNINTVGEFNELSYYQARSRAEYYAQNGVPND